MSSKSVTVTNWHMVSNCSSRSVIGTRSVIDLMQCLDYSKSRSVIGTLVETGDEFDLGMNSDSSISTIQHGTTIDAVFMRRLEYLKSQVYVSYFRYHKSIVTCLSLEHYAPIF